MKKKKEKKEEKKKTEEKKGPIEKSWNCAEDIINKKRTAY